MNLIGSSRLEATLNGAPSAQPLDMVITGFDPLKHGLEDSQWLW
jgi:hypothetical protein